MSQQITTAMVKMFSANVFHLSQQKGSRLRGFVRLERQKGEVDHYDRIGVTSAQKLVGRHQETTYQDTPHSRRAVSIEKYFQADLVDKLDKLKIIQNPESEYAQSFSMSMGRSMDDVTIAAGLGSAATGKHGESLVPLPDSQKRCAVANDYSDSSGAGNPLNVASLRMVKKIFNQNEAGDYDLYAAISAEQLDNMLGEEKITSSDYAVVKALVNGDINTFMGFRFIRTERLPVTSAVTNFQFVNGSLEGTATDSAPAGSRRCMFWQKMGIILSIGEDVTGRITEMPTKHYSTQVYYCMSLGGVRMEEAKVVELICKES